jgi:hypothetical protein
MLEIANGDILTGQSVDISPRGVLMESDTPPEMALLGIAGTLFIISEKGHFSIGYPCRVVRLERRSIAWEIEKKPPPRLEMRWPRICSDITGEQVCIKKPAPKGRRRRWLVH